MAENENTERFTITEVTHYHVEDTQAEGHGFLYDGTDKEEAEAIVTNLREMQELRDKNAEMMASGEPLSVELTDEVDLGDDAS